MIKNILIGFGMGAVVTTGGCDQLFNIEIELFKQGFKLFYELTKIDLWEVNINEIVSKRP